MTLSPKTQQQFSQWIEQQEVTIYDFTGTPVPFEKWDERIRMAFIVEFFDSVGIYITINYSGLKQCFCWSLFHETKCLGAVSTSRKLATAAAIIAADEILTRQSA